MAKMKKQAKASAAATVLPSQHGADHLKVISGVMARDLSADYISAKFEGRAARCPMTPSAQTAIVHDRKRIVLSYGLETTTSSNLDANLTLLVPSIERVVSATADAALSYDTAAGDIPTLVAPINAVFGADRASISNQLSVFEDNRDHGFYPYNGDQQDPFPGWQIYDHASLGAGGAVQFDLRVRLFVQPTIDISAATEFKVIVASRDASGVLNNEVTVGNMFPGEYFNATGVLPYTAQDETLCVELSPVVTGDNIAGQLDGNVTVEFTPSTGVADVIYDTPLVQRFLRNYDLDTGAEIVSNSMAVRTLTGLFSFDGPMITQGGFVAISEIKANETIRASDLVDYLGSRPLSHYGKVVEGAYGVYMEDSLEEFNLKKKIAPFSGDAKYIMCASRISDPTSRLNLVLSLEAGIEFVTNSRLYEQAVATPAMYPAMLFAIMQSLPRFSSNDGHLKEVVEPAKKLQTEAAKVSNGGKSSFWGKLWSGAKSVGSALLPLLPTLLAAL